MSERAMREDQRDMLGMLGQGYLQEKERIAGQDWSGIAHHIQHHTEHLAMRPVIARSLEPEGAEILQQLRHALFVSGKKFVIAQTRIKRHWIKIEAQLLAGKLIIPRLSPVN